MKILKQIVIVSDRDNMEMELGRIIYTRPITDHYNFKQEHDENVTQVDKILQGYPQQRNYPNDELDGILLSAVQKRFPKSVVVNDTILFNIDLEKLKVLKNRAVLNAAIFFSPEFSNIMDVMSFAGKEFRAPRIKINIYSYYRPEYLENQIFYANYNAEAQEVLDQLDSVQFE